MSQPTYPTPMPQLCPLKQLTTFLSADGSLLLSSNTSASNPSTSLLHHHSACQSRMLPTVIQENLTLQVGKRRLRGIT